MSAIRFYGIEVWEHDVLQADIPTLAEAAKIERMYIHKFDTFESGYNSTYGGEGVDIPTGEDHPLYGIPKSAEHTAKSVVGRKKNRDTWSKEKVDEVALNISKAALLRYASKHYSLYHQKHGIVNGLLSIIRKEYNIHSEIYNVVSGKRRHIQGWFRWRGLDGNYDVHPIYVFKHRDYGQETLTLKAMAKKYNLSKGNLCMVVKGQRNHTKGWYLHAG